MSESNTSGTGAQSASHFWKPCVLLIDDGFFGGKSVGLESEITTTLQVHRETHSSSWMGFTIQVPFGANNGDDGSGKCHEWNWTLAKLAQEHKMTVVFPMEPDYFIRDVEQSLLAALPENTKTLSRLDFHSKA
ncbi:hypothetical protein A0O28_0007060 [Trichoderma guizhouense]|uniref:Uncharacterized protein n=1 Tax=Trichoderma guizhouense TaxID=1491466 RepID=A0A1T3CHP4_9HYPO|nr:hypothetical protein A0O28_0007060 [Trichoderma guizhouense]